MLVVPPHSESSSSSPTIEDLKAQIRRDLTVKKLINKEITSHITITDADVANFYNANKESFNLAEPQVRLVEDPSGTRFQARAR